MYSQVRGQTQTPVWPLQQMLEVNKVTTISLPRYLCLIVFQKPCSCFCHLFGNSSHLDLSIQAT